MMAAATRACMSSVLQQRSRLPMFIAHDSRVLTCQLWRRSLRCRSTLRVFSRRIAGALLAATTYAVAFCQLSEGGIGSVAAETS